jgi:hypothetical protein
MPSLSTSTASDNSAEVVIAAIARREIMFTFKESGSVKSTLTDCANLSVRITLFLIWPGRSVNKFSFKYLFNSAIISAEHSFSPSTWQEIFLIEKIPDHPTT